jgi:formamidase
VCSVEPFPKLEQLKMNGLSGLNKSPGGVVVGLAQLQLPVVETPAQLAAQTQKIVDMVGKARRGYAHMDLIVFPEYALHGLSMSTAPDLMVSMDGPEVEAMRQACITHRIWGCFSIMEANPGGNPYNTGIIFDDQGVLKLYYRKFHPWVPVEPWEPGNMGIPVIEGPRGIKLALIICHDGMFPEMARECAYKGAELMLRTAGYTAPSATPGRSPTRLTPFRTSWPPPACACVAATAASIRWVRPWSATTKARWSRKAAVGPTRSSAPRSGQT